MTLFNKGKEDLTKEEEISELIKTNPWVIDRASAINYMKVRKCLTEHIAQRDMLCARILNNSFYDDDT